MMVFAIGLGRDLARDAKVLGDDPKQPVRSSSISTGAKRWR